MGKAKSVRKYLSVVALILSVFTGVLPLGSSSPSSVLAAQQQQTSFIDQFEVKAAGSSYLLQFTTSNSVKVEVKYALKNTKEMQTLVSSHPSKKHQFKLDGLTQNSQYVAVVSVVDSKSTYSETLIIDTTNDPKVKLMRNEVSYSQSSTGNVNIQVTSNETEPNDQFDEANSRPPATSIIGKIGWSNDPDFYLIYVNAKTNGKLNVFVDVPSNKDYDLTVYDLYANVIGGSYGGTGADELFSRMGMAPGYYFAKVYGYNGAYDSTQNYSLAWRFYPELAWPVPGSNYISSGFNDPNRTNHKGTDISFNSAWGLYESWNYEVQAIKAGTVVDRADNTDTRGYTVTVDHNYQNGKRVYARYLHFDSAALVTNGSSVAQYQRLGWMGNTGDSTGKHLHIDFNTYSSPYPNDYRYDPMSLLALPHSNEVTDYWEKNSGYKYSK